MLNELVPSRDRQGISNVLNGMMSTWGFVVHHLGCESSLEHWVLYVVAHHHNQNTPLKIIQASGGVEWTSPREAFKLAAMFYHGNLARLVDS